MLVRVSVLDATLNTSRSFFSLLDVGDDSLMTAAPLKPSVVSYYSASSEVKVVPLTSGRLLYGKSLIETSVSSVSDMM